MVKRVSFILILMFSISLASSLGYVNPNYPKLEAPTQPTASVNNNTLNVNNSQYWQGYTPTSYITAVLNGEYIRRDGGNSPTANINWNFFGIFNVGDSNFTNNVFVDNQLTLGTGGSNLEISFNGITNLFNTTGKNALFIDNLTASNLFAGNICYTNGTGCTPSANFTNVAFLNNTQTFIRENTFSNNVTFTQGSWIDMTPRINIGNITSNVVTGTRAIGIGGRSSTRGLNSAGTDSIAFGNGAISSSTSTISIGANANVTSSNGIAIGTATASAQFCQAIGSSASCSGTSSFAMGRTASASGTQAAAIGANSESSGSNCLALGGGALGTGAKCFGSGSVSVGTNSGAGYFTDGFSSDSYSNTQSNVVIGAGSFIHNSSSSAIIGTNNIIQSGALGFVVGKANTLSGNITGGILGNSLTNNLNNSLLIGLDLNVTYGAYVQNNVTLMSNLFLTGIPSGATGTDTDYLCINRTSGRVFRNETGC